MKEQNKIPDAVAVGICHALTGISNETLDTMTIVVKANGPALHDFVYALPRDKRLKAAKPDTWKYMDTRYWKVGDVVSLLCLCSVRAGFKKLTPVLVLEVSKDEKRSIAQSSLWNLIKVKKGDHELLEAALKYMDKENP